MNMDYKKYAKLIFNISQKNSSDYLNSFLNKMIFYLKEKKQIVLLPRIYNELKKLFEKENKLKSSVLILENNKNLLGYKKELQKYENIFNLKNLKIEINKNIIGGFVIKNRKNILNNSHKKKLLDLYQKFIS